MDVTYSMTSVNTGGIRENNRRDLVINYCKTLDSNFSMMQETHVNFSHLHDVRELWNGEVIISPGKAQTCVLVLWKRTAPPIEQIKTNLAGKYIFFNIRNTTDAVLALYTLSGSMKERRIDKQMFTRKIKKLLYKKITRNNYLILLSDFNMTLGNKDRSTGSNGSCEAQEELISLV